MAKPRKKRQEKRPEWTYPKPRPDWISIMKT